MARPGFFTDHPDAVKLAISLRQIGLKHYEIAQRLTDEIGIPISSDGVRQHLARIGIQTGRGTSSRYALLSELERLGRKVDVDDLAGAGGGAERAVPLLHSLKKQGLVSFVESTSSMGNGRHHRGIIRIEITDAGRAYLHGTAPSAPQEEVIGAAETVSDYEVAAVISRFPLLDGLKQRLLRHQRLVELLREAAELAEDADLGIALLEKADAPPLSPVELEYVRYADEVTHG